MIEVDRHIHQLGGGNSAASAASAVYPSAMSTLSTLYRISFSGLKHFVVSTTDTIIGFYAKFCIKMVSFIKIGPFFNSAALGGLGGKMAAQGRRRRLEGAAWCQNVRNNILVTGKKFFRTI